MTEDDSPAFLACYKRLHLALTSAKIDEARIAVYFEALEDLPLALVERAAEFFSKSGSKFPPAPWWRAQAKKEAGRTPLPAHNRGPLDPPHCSSCDDTGWRLDLHCDGINALCGKRTEHAEHRYTTACDCRRRNPVYQQRLRDDRARRDG